jgi:hypothetical protein
MSTALEKRMAIKAKTTRSADTQKVLKLLASSIRKELQVMNLPGGAAQSCYSQGRQAAYNDVLALIKTLLK